MNATTKSTILVPAEHGAPFEGGFYGGQITSHGGAKIFAVAWASKSAEIRGPWLGKYTDVPGARSCFHSMDNTRAMAAAGSKAAKKIIGMEINGRTDWCLPARDVLELAYRHLKPGTDTDAYGRAGDNPSSIPVGYPYRNTELPQQTACEAFRQGGAEAFEADWYWSSTQYSEYDAWTQRFSDGGQSSDDKKFEGLFRPVRLIQLNP